MLVGRMNEFMDVYLICLEIIDVLQGRPKFFGIGMDILIISGAMVVRSDRLRVLPVLLLTNVIGSFPVLQLQMLVDRRVLVYSMMIGPVVPQPQPILHGMLLHATVLQMRVDKKIRVPFRVLESVVQQPQPILLVMVMLAIVHLMLVDKKILAQSSVMVVVVLPLLHRVVIFRRL